ncbi:MAG: bactofilin family protein [Candidatus Rokuibacteriota bacterium]
MAIFTDKGTSGIDAEAGLSIIAAGMEVVGDVVAEGIVKVEGAIRGNLRVGRQVLVAKGGLVEGDIQTREAIIGGEVRGAITASQRVEVQPGSVVHGDLATPMLLVQEGGEVNGVLRMGANVAEAAAVHAT